MEFQDYENFVNRNNKRGIITTYRRNGAGHVSIVVRRRLRGQGGLRHRLRQFGQGAQPQERQPLHRHRRQRGAGGAPISVEGTATTMSFHDTDAETMRVKLREVYLACSAPRRPPRLGGVRPGHGQPGRRNRPRRAGAGLRLYARLGSVTLGRGAIAAPAAHTCQTEANECRRKSVEAIRIVEDDGWYYTYTRGSHRYFEHPVKPGKVLYSGEN